MANSPQPVEFRNDGTIRFSAGDRVIRTRRPTLREFRELRELLWETNDAISDASEALREEAKRRQAEIEEVSGSSDDPVATALGNVGTSVAMLLLALPPEQQTQDLQDRATEFVTFLESSTGTAAAESDGGELSDEQATEVRRITRESNRALREFTTSLDEIRLRWTRTAVDLLDTSGKSLDDDEVEQWMADPKFIERVSRHLQTVPLAPGG